MIIIGSMLPEVIKWLGVALIFILGFGFCFMVLLPAAQSTAPEFLLRPFFITFWGLLGDFDVPALYENFAVSGSFEEDITIVILPLLLWLYIFVTTVILVNLLIAQMSSVYEEVREKADQVWKFERVDLITEFKDSRDSAPHEGSNPE